MNILYMRQTKRVLKKTRSTSANVVRKRRTAGMLHTKKRNTKKRSVRNTKKRNSRNSKKMIKGGDVAVDLANLIDRNLEIRVDNIVLHDPTTREEISNNDISTIKEVLYRANNADRQLFDIDGEEDDFKAVLFNYLFKRLKLKLYPPASPGFDQNHWAKTLQGIKDSKIINELEEYGYNDDDFERIKEYFKNTKRKRDDEDEEDEEDEEAPKLRRPDSDFPIYGDDRV